MAEVEQQRTIEDLQQIAEDHGWILNPDDAQVEGILKGQNMLKQKFGEFYCPCYVNHTEETVCPCVYSEEDVRKKGQCHCNLFHSPAEE